MVVSGFLRGGVLAAALMYVGLAKAASPVSLETVDAREVEQSLPINGTLTADRAALLSAAVEGLVTELDVDLGDTVEAGDVLLKLDAELNQRALETARANADQSQAELADARRRLDEANRLAERQSIAASQVRGLESEVTVAESALASARAEQKRQAALLERHRLKAPFDGVISEKSTELGEWVTPGTAVLGLVNVENLRADFQVPQEYFPRVSRDSRLEVRLHRDGDPLPARITAIVPVNDADARTFLVRARFENTPRVTPGMSVRADLYMRGDQEYITAPRDALVRHPDGRISIWVAEQRDGALLAREKRVRTGESLDERVVILEGLDAGDRVVVRGNESLDDGEELESQE